MTAAAIAALGKLADPHPTGRPREIAGVTRYRSFGLRRARYELALRRVATAREFPSTLAALVAADAACARM